MSNRSATLLQQLVEIMHRCEPDYVEAHPGTTECSYTEWDDAIKVAEAHLQEVFGTQQSLDLEGKPS